MSVTIRPAQPDEFNRLGEIESSAAELFKDIGMDEIAEGDPMPAEFVVAFGRFGAAFVAERDNALAGFALVAPFDIHAHLYEISVARDHQGHGIGRKLVDAVCDWSKNKGFKAITLSTFQDVPWNAPFYESVGFRKLKRFEWSPAMHMMRGREESAGLDTDRRCLMRKDLVS